MSNLSPENNEFYPFEVQEQLARSGLENAKWHFLNLITCGLSWGYYQEARRSQLWQRVSFLDRPCSYQGDGHHYNLLHLGSLASLALAFAATLAVATLLPEWQVQALIASALLGFLVYPIWTYYKYRWVIAHLRWGEESLRWEMPFLMYYSRYLGGLILTTLSFGLYWPYWRNEIFALHYGHLSSETLAIRYTGDARDLWEDYVTALPMVVATGGIYAFWFSAKIQRYRCANLWVGHHEVGRARGYYKYHGEQALLEWTLAGLSTILTVGLAWPWVASLRSYWHWRWFGFVGKLYMDKKSAYKPDSSRSGETLSTFA